MFTLISTRPIFLSSGSSDVWMRCRNASRSRLISSIFIDAITWRNWPKMMSCACRLIWSCARPSRRIAAFCRTSASVPMATVNTLGTATRMFSNESASLSGMSIWIGSRDRYAYSWITGHTNAPPPEMHRALPSPPTLPEITSTRFAGQRRYRDANRISSPTTTTAASTGPMSETSGSPSPGIGSWRSGATLSASIGNLVQQDGISDDDHGVCLFEIHDEH